MKAAPASAVHSVGMDLASATRWLFAVSDSLPICSMYSCRISWLRTLQRSGHSESQTLEPVQHLRKPRAV